MTIGRDKEVSFWWHVATITILKLLKVHQGGTVHLWRVPNRLPTRVIFRSSWGWGSWSWHLDFVHWGSLTKFRDNDDGSNYNRNQNRWLRVIILIIRATPSCTAVFVVEWNWTSPKEFCECSSVGWLLCNTNKKSINQLPWSLVGALLSWRDYVDRLVIIGERRARDRDQIDVLCNTIIVERDYRCFLNKINGQFRYFL